MAKTLNDIIEDAENDISSENISYSNSNDFEINNFEKISSELNIDKLDVENNESISSFADTLVKHAYEIESASDPIPASKQLNPVEKIAEFVMIADMLKKKFQLDGEIECL